MYGAWHAHHPRADEVPDDSRRARIGRAYRQVRKVCRGKAKAYTPDDHAEAVRRLCLVVDHLHLASEWHRADPARLGVAYMFRYDQLSDRVDAALRWAGQGRPEAAPAPVGAEHQAEGTKAWQHVRRLILVHGARLLDYRLHPIDDAKDRAVRHALAEAGGIDVICQASTWDLDHELCDTFVASYARQRAQPEQPT